MSSLPRRMQRVATRRKPSGIPQFGSQLGVHNPKAPDLLARLDRETRVRAEYPKAPAPVGQRHSLVI